MFFPWTRSAAIVALVAISVMPNTSLLANEATGSSELAALNKQEIVERLATLQLPVSVEANEQVLAQILQYITTGKKETEAILGRASIYFPVFEHQLRASGLPESLKYLPLIESALLPAIKSPVGATGMWQFMPSSARQFGLEIANGVDERMDPYRSTRAATKMLESLYNQFGDWSLVLAAYNSGAGKVSMAVRLAGSSDYWKVQEFLPKETQRYVPAFIAAAYVSKYYRQHNLQPNMAQALASDVRVLRIYRRISFGEIARVTGLPLATIGKLNPAFTQGIVPQSEAGYFIALPDENATSLLRQFLNSPEQKAIADSGKVFRTTYVVSKGDNLQQIAKLFQTTTEDLKKWNNLNHDDLEARQELVLYLPKSFLLNRA